MFGNGYAFIIKALSKNSGGFGLAEFSEHGPRARFQVMLAIFWRCFLEKIGSEPIVSVILVGRMPSKWAGPSLKSGPDKSCENMSGHSHACTVTRYRGPPRWCNIPWPGRHEVPRGGATFLPTTQEVSSFYVIIFIVIVSFRLQVFLQRTEHIEPSISA